MRQGRTSPHLLQASTTVPPSVSYSEIVWLWRWLWLWPPQVRLRHSPMLEIVEAVLQLMYSSVTYHSKEIGLTSPANTYCSELPCQQGITNNRAAVVTHRMVVEHMITRVIFHNRALKVCNQRCHALSDAHLRAFHPTHLRMSEAELGWGTVSGLEISRTGDIDILPSISFTRVASSTPFQISQIRPCGMWDVGYLWIQQVTSS